MTATINGDQNGTVGLINTMTAQATTSGTAIDFTGIPAGVKRITVMLNGVSLSGISMPRIQIGAGVIEITGYAGVSSILGAGTASGVFSGAGFDLYESSPAATYAYTGVLNIYLIGSNTWICSGVFSNVGRPATLTIAGNKTTSGTLDRVRLTTVNGTDTFDAGSVNILYE